MNELSLYILDITENSIHANSKVVNLSIIESHKDNVLKIEIIDDGCGMDEETVKKVIDPFYTTRTTRKVGLGIPLFKELCELCEGNLKIDSKAGVGTKVVGTFKLDSIDLPPLGNIVDTLCCLVANDQNVDIIFKYIKDEKEFSFSTIEIKEVLDGVSIKEPDILSWFKEFVTEGLQ